MVRTTGLEPAIGASELCGLAPAVPKIAVSTISTTSAPSARPFRITLVGAGATPPPFRRSGQSSKAGAWLSPWLEFGAEGCSWEGLPSASSSGRGRSRNHHACLDCQRTDTMSSPRFDKTEVRFRRGFPPPTLAPNFGRLSTSSMDVIGWPFSARASLTPSSIVTLLGPICGGVVASPALSKPDSESLRRSSRALHRIVNSR